MVANFSRSRDSLLSSTTSRISEYARYSAIINRHMFTPQELQEQLARIERLWPELQDAPREESVSGLESPKQPTGRARQIDLLRKLLMPPALATS